MSGTVTLEPADTVTLSSADAVGSTNLTSSGTVTSGLTANAFPGGFTTGTGWTTTSSTSASPWFTRNNVAPKIQLDGEGADIEVNGWSLVAAIKQIEDRLGLFQLNPQLESEWSDLQALGEQYRKLEQHIKDKQATWDRLRARPHID